MKDKPGADERYRQNSEAKKGSFFKPPFYNRYMKLNEITNLFRMDYGGPSPHVIINEGHTYVSFYTDLDEDQLEKPDLSSSEGRIVIKFNSCTFSRFGPPSNETISGHPYYKYGMNSGGFYELEDSDLIQSLVNVDKIHPYHNSERRKTYKHFILTFHDNIFECVATDFEVNNVDTDLYKHEESLFDKLSEKF